MADVFANVCTPDVYKTDALFIAAGTISFVSGFSPTGNAPATHWIGGGNIPQEIRDAFVSDSRFTVSASNWRDFAASMGLQRVVQSV